MQRNEATKENDVLKAHQEQFENEKTHCEDDNVTAMREQSRIDQESEKLMNR